MFFCKKDPLFNNHKAKVVKTTSRSLIDFDNPFTGINFREYNPINYCLETESLIGCKNLIKNKSNIAPKYYYDFEEVLEYLSINKKQLTSIVDKHRNEEIWLKGKNGWELRQKLI